MPPEQALGQDVTPQADLYSLGAMLYELVTGNPPFVGEDPTAVISQHLNTAPVRPSLRSDRCPPDLGSLILRLLAKAPADRPASAAEVLAVLGGIDPDARSASDSHMNPLDRLARGVFVGREGELERLRSAADEAFAGRGSVVMLVGEPGIGKTRTAQELETYARMRGAQVMWGRAHEASGAPAYWPWVQVGRAWGRSNDVAALAEVLAGAGSELVRLFPELPGILGQQAPELPAVADESAQFRLFDSYVSFLRAASQDSPLVIVLDDIHWADKPTLLLLQHLAREVSNAGLLVVGTYRDTELSRTRHCPQWCRAVQQLFPGAGPPRRRPRCGRARATASPASGAGPRARGARSPWTGSACASPRRSGRRSHGSGARPDRAGRTARRGGAGDRSAARLPLRPPLARAARGG